MRRDQKGDVVMLGPTMDFENHFDKRVECPGAVRAEILGRFKVEPVSSGLRELMFAKHALDAPVAVGLSAGNFNPLATRFSRQPYNKAVCWLSAS